MRAVVFLTLLDIGIRKVIKHMSLSSIFASKSGMTQAWDISGKRFAVTKCRVLPNVVLGMQVVSTKDAEPRKQVLIGYGNKKLANMTKPLRSIVEKSGFSKGVAQIRGVAAVAADAEFTPGTIITSSEVLEVGSVVKVQGVTKGRGFAGAMKRHGFHGGPATHGQSDRARAVGSIGAGTTPGRVIKGKKMPGHYGVETQTVKGLIVLHIDNQTGEVWLSGPVPGALNATVQIIPTGAKKSIELNTSASGIVVAAPEVVAPEAEATEVSSDNQENQEVTA